MPVCQKIKATRRSVCVGDLRSSITIKDRAITPTMSAVDGNFTMITGAVNSATVFALIKTVAGETLLNGVGAEIQITHHIYIRFLSWITFKSIATDGVDNFEILNVENLDNRNEFLLLRCTNRGDVAENASIY